MTRPPAEITALTGLRGLAAITVFIAHFDFPALVPSTRKLFAVFRWHEEAVDLFFWLSGFVLMLVYSAKLSHLVSAEWRAYFAARFARIFPVHLLSLAAAVGIFAIGSVIKGKWPEYITTWGIAVNMPLLQNWPGLFIPSVSTASWSLSVECFCYLFITPVSVVITSRINRASLFLAGVVIALGLRLLIPTSMFDWPSLGRGIIGFLGGTFLFGLWSRTSGGGGRSCATFGTISLAVITAGKAWADWDPRWLFFTFPPLIYGLASAVQSWPHSLLSSRLAVWLGDISYSLYLWHGPLALIMLYNCRPLLLNSPMLIKIGWILAEAGIALGVATLSHYRFERPARDWIRTLLERRPSVKMTRAT